MSGAHAAIGLLILVLIALAISFFDDKDKE